MKKSRLLEICVETLEAAVAAERGGADRIELCEHLLAGGATPSLALMREVRRSVHIPVHVMIRPRAGNFCFTTSEYEEMRRAIGLAQAERMDGVVLGILTPEAEVDVARTAELVKLAKPLPVTFHRAFDEAHNLSEALQAVIATGARRLLTSGGAATAEQGAAKIAGMVEAGRDDITLMPGGGIHAGNLRRIVLDTGAREFHSGLSSVLPYSRQDYAAFEKEVRKLAGALDKFAEAGAPE